MIIPQNKIILIVLIELFCITMFSASFDVENVFLDPNALSPMSYPRILLIIMMMSLAPLLIFSEKEQYDLKSLKAVFFELLLLSLSMIGYYIVLSILGFVLSAFLLLFLCLSILRYKSLGKKLLFSGIISLFFWFLFNKIMLIPLPSGILGIF